MQTPTLVTLSLTLSLVASFAATTAGAISPRLPALPTAIPRNLERDVQSTNPGNATKRKYKDIQDLMAAAAASAPQVAKVFDLGLNDTGQMIQGISIGTGPVNNVIVGTHHGNEFGSTELAIAFIQYLIDAPIAGQTIHVIPVLNVSGYDARSRYELGRDPNRDYEGPCGTDGPFKLRSTKLLADFLVSKDIVASATLHTFGPVVLYPWGFSTRDLKTEYDDLYISLSNDAAIESKYEVGNSAAALYPADGCYEDYAMWKQGVWSLLFELGNTHNPSQNGIDEIIRGNLPGIRRFFVNAPTTRAEKHAFTGKCDVRLKNLRVIEE